MQVRLSQAHHREKVIKLLSDHEEFLMNFCVLNNMKNFPTNSGTLYAAVNITYGV